MTDNDKKETIDKKISFPDLYMGIANFGREWQYASSRWNIYAHQLIRDIPPEKKLEYTDNLINNILKFEKEYLPKLEEMINAEEKNRIYSIYISSARRNSLLPGYWFENELSKDGILTFNEKILDVTKKYHKLIDKYKSNAHPEAVKENSECIQKVEGILQHIEDYTNNKHERIELTEKDV